MHHHYSDILDRIDEKPRWWDENGVPRYCEFTPHERVNVDADQVVLMRIECQRCQTEFLVAMSSGPLDRCGPYGTLEVRVSVRGREPHYGDPPNAGCCPAGPTMNSVPREVVQFWERNRFDWRRRPDLERPIRCGVDAEEGARAGKRRERRTERRGSVSDYEPELGQAVFSGSPWGEVESPEYVAVGLQLLGLIVGNGNWEDEPTGNVAASFTNDVFEMRSYCWCDNDMPGHEDGCPPNFKCGDFEARWYKYAGRGHSQNREVSIAEWRGIVSRCLASLSLLDRVGEDGVRMYEFYLRGVLVAESWGAAGARLEAAMDASHMLSGGGGISEFHEEDELLNERSGT